MLPVAAALSAGCLGQVGGTKHGRCGFDGRYGNGGTGGRPIGPSGAAGIAPPCTGPADPRMVVAPQRIMRLTGVETINTVRDIVNAAEAAALLAAGILPTDETNPAKRNFPPLGRQLDQLGQLPDPWKASPTHVA